MKPVLLPFIRVALVAVLCSALSVGSAPVLPSSLDVELVDIRPDGDDIVQSSMITPFPSGNAGGGLHPDEPNFFWSGSGDDPDAGMTYWITTTVYKTAVVTMTPITPKPSIATATYFSSSSITPTPPTRKESSPPTWPVEVFQPRSWIRTVIRSDADESSPRFRQLLQSRLGRIYSDLLLQQRNGSAATFATHVIIQNISRKANDLDVVYSLWNGHHPATGGVADPYLTVAAVRKGDVTRELCRRQANDTQQDVLCQSVVTQAEPFVRAEETSVAAAASVGQQFWIVGAIVGAILVVILIAVLIFLINRSKKTPKDKKDVAVGESPVLPKAKSSSTSFVPARFSRSSSKKSKSVEKSSSTAANVEDHPDPWVRKARSTSKKHQRRQHRRPRPQTAPERNAHRQSSSSLSAIVSGSGSSASSSVDRMEYRLSREEPVQPSRGARRLKQKRSSKTDVFSSDKKKEGEDAVVGKRPVPKPRRRADASIEMETQEVTADFTDHPDSPDEDPSSAEPKKILTLDDCGWRPGSLIPSKVTAGVFGSRKISSAPVPLEAGRSKDGQRPVQHRRAWSSSDPVEKSIRPTSNVDIVMPTNYESSGNENSESHTTSERADAAQARSHLRNPSLHIHSISYPAWPSLSDTDPAIELIRSIKEELKKFEPKVS